MGKNTKAVAILALVAFGAGVATGLLTAPKSGKETREDLKKASGKLKEELDKRYSEVQGSLSDAIDQAMSQVGNFRGGAQEKLEYLIDQAKQAEFKVKDVYRGMRHGDVDDKNLDKAIDEANKAKNHLFKFLNK
jgi:gas vesicle protein